MGWLKKYQNGGYSTAGYKADSPDRNNPYNIIPSGRITMQNVPHPVLGIDNFGNKQMMQPGGEYQFPGETVFEVPAMKEGGIPQRYKNMGFTRVGQKKTGDGQHKWKVLAKKGDSYKVVQGGYRGMQDFKQHGSQERRDRFWDRMGGRDSSKAKDPFSPLYWHKRFGTWEYGGPVPSSEMYKDGGMIRRADGSYSQRGLWDNIRANAGSGKKPTKEMLQQERKIRSAEKKQYGGWLNQYQEGGNWKADPTATIYSVPVKGKTAPVMPRPQDGVPRTMTAQEIAELERTENPIRKKIRTFDAQNLVPKSALHPENQLLGMVGNMVVSPVKAINSLTDPEHNYTGTPESNMLQFGMDASEAVPALNFFTKGATKGITKLYNIPEVKNIVDESVYNTIDKISDIPANNKYLQPYYKRAAYNVMTQSGNATRDWKDIVKTVLKPGNYKGDRFLGLTSNDKIRDLPKLYVYGDERGFVKNELQPIGIERYQKKYGPLNSYDLEMYQDPNYSGYTQEAIDMMQDRINKAIAEKGVYAKGVGEGSISLQHYRPADDIAGHMNYVYEDPSGAQRLRIQDIWKFDPDDYAKRWSSDITNPKGGLKSRIQARLIEKAGKPFVLSKDYPFELKADSGEDISELGKFDKFYTGEYKNLINEDLLADMLKKKFISKKHGGWLKKYK